MQNSYDNSRDFRAGEAIQFLTDLSPFFIILTTIISLMVIFFIDITYLSGVFFPIMGRLGYFVAFLVPCGILVARLGFGLLGASDISKGSWISGGLGLIGTFAIAFFEHHALTHIATVWKMVDQIGLFQFMVWLAVGSELRLMMTLGNENNLLNTVFGKKEQEKSQKHRKPKKGGNGKPNPKDEEHWEWNMNFKEQPT